MSWEQDYDIESLEVFFQRILKISSIELFCREFFNRKIKIEIDPIVVVPADGITYYQDCIGARITIIRGKSKKVYIPKLVGQFTSNGNYGCDTYRYVEENKKVKVKRENQE